LRSIVAIIVIIIMITMITTTATATATTETGDAHMKDGSRISWNAETDLGLSPQKQRRGRARVILNIRKRTV